MSKITKRMYTLNVNGFSKEITAITYPFLKYWADKIGAEFHVISERKFPGFPITYEKLQIYELARSSNFDWHIYVDSDALVHPETLDFTAHIPMNTVAHNGIDLASIRWRNDDVFMRDGRYVGSCNWMTFGSRWCIDLWHPLEDITLEEALSNIRPTREERACGIEAEHLIDDYTLSRNIARFGLKCTTLMQIQKDMGLTDANFFHHLYTLTTEEKIKSLQECIKLWKLENFHG